MPYFDPGYFKKTAKVNRNVKRSVKNKLAAWKLDKEYYDGDRNNGYGGFKYDGRWTRGLSQLNFGTNQEMVTRSVSA